MVRTAIDVGSSIAVRSFIFLFDPYESFDYNSIVDAGHGGKMDYETARGQFIEWLKTIQTLCYALLGADTHQDIVSAHEYQIQTIHFIDTIADSLFVVSADGIPDYEAGYQDWVFEYHLNNVVDRVCNVWHEDLTEFPDEYVADITVPLCKTIIGECQDYIRQLT